MPQLKVPEVPSYEEFYGLVDNRITEDEFESTSEKDEEIRKLIVLALSVLENFYLEHQFDSEFDVVTEEFKEQIDDLNTELKESILLLFKDYIESVEVDKDLEYELPANTVSTDFDIETVINSGVDSVTQTLYADLKNKADFYHDVAITTGVFSLHANFRRAIKKLDSVISKNAQYFRSRVDRSYLEFVYGQEKLFHWVTSGRNTCAWCYEIEAMGAMPLSWFPVDHPNGMCRLVPDDPNDYSDEYIFLKGIGAV